MRTTLLLFSIMLAITSCKKDSKNQSTSNSPQIGITYPASVDNSYPDSLFWGKNILAYADSTVLHQNIEYEMGAVLEKNASLVIVITNYPVLDTIYGHTTMWFYDQPNGWAVTDYDNVKQTQKFMSTLTGKIDLQIDFQSYGVEGKCKVDFYENGNTITRTKYYFWK